MKKLNKAPIQINQMVTPFKTRKLKKVLVLSGGGFVGATQWGFLMEAHRLGVEFDTVFGISVGTLNGSIIAMNRYDLLDHLWNDVVERGHAPIYDSKYLTVNGSTLGFRTDALVSSILPKLNVGTVWKLLSAKGREKLVTEVLGNVSDIRSLASNLPLQQTLTNYLNIEEYKTPFYFGVVSLTDGKFHLFEAKDFNDNPNLVKAVAASATMPIVWEPIDEIKSTNKIITEGIDGGVRSISPLKYATDYITNAEEDDSEYEIIIVNCNNGEVDVLNGEMNLLTIANRSLNEITLSQILQNDINQFVTINNLVTQASQNNTSLYSPSGKKYKNFKYRLVQPEDSSLSGVLDSSKEMLLKRKEWGIYQAQKVFADFKV